MYTANMKTVSEKRANDYFMEMTIKVYKSIVKPSEIESHHKKWGRHYSPMSFEDYLKKRYRDSCYYYSTYAVLGLDDKARLVRGYQNTGVNYHRPYHHGWVNFDHEGQEFTFDSMVDGIVTKEKWDNHYTPEITANMSRKEILDFCLSDEQCEKSSNIWTIKDHEPPLWNDFGRPINKRELVAIFPHSRFIMSTKGLKQEIEKCILYNPPRE